MLDVAEEILNRCTKRDPACDVYKNKYCVAFNYEFIEDACTEGSGNEEEGVVYTNPSASKRQSGVSADIVKLV